MLINKNHSHRLFIVDEKLVNFAKAKGVSLNDICKMLKDFGKRKSRTKKAIV
jgi:hypothetical protein